jgi:hypothetical protein
MNWYIKITNINQKNTQHTSVVKNLPRRQYHIRVPPEVHPRIREPEYKLRHLPPYLCCLLRKVMSPFTTAMANQNLGPPPQARISYPWYLQLHPRPQCWHPLQEKGHQDGAKRKLPLPVDRQRSSYAIICACSIRPQANRSRPTTTLSINVSSPPLIRWGARVPYTRTIIDAMQ